MNEMLVPTRRHDSLRAHNPTDFNEAATQLILRYGSVILDDARRFSSCVADAEDAYQRTLEILLTKAPTSDPDQLVPWLRTIARREAADIALHRQRIVASPTVYPAEHDCVPEDSPEEVAEGLVDFDHSNEALQRLDGDQVRCLLAHAEGYSYSEIATQTGFSNRKVKRCLADGRRAFLNRVQAIRSGTECSRIEPLLHRALDGDIDAYKDARPHINGCGACRATLRAYSEAPSRAAALFPLPVVTATADQPPTGQAWDVVTGIWTSVYEKAVAHATTVHQWAEVGTVKKASAVAATAAALAAGSVAVENTTDNGREPSDRPTAERPADTGPTPVVAPEIEPPVASRPEQDTTPAERSEPEPEAQPIEQPADLLAPESVATVPQRTTEKPARSKPRPPAGTGDLAP
ncbi:MAG: sigma-70 family RNA polymerase sigma factor [Solirubrobacterales bacterium]